MDTTELTHKINHLHTAYHHLEEAKYATGQTRDERTMRPGGRLGPQTPGHTKPVNLCIELETRLYDYVCDAKRYITPTRMLPKNWDTMLPWLKFNAEQITTLEPGYVDELALELDYQTRRINRLIQPTAPRTDRPEPWHPARTVITLCAGQGHRVTQGQLRQLAHRGTIEAQASGNRNLYRTSQVLQHLKGQQQ